MAEPVVLPIELIVEPATVNGAVALATEIDVQSPVSVLLPVSISVYNASAFPGHNGTVNGGTFSVAVQIGGQDLTSRLKGTIEIDAEEGAARVATLSLVLETGTFEPDDWINLPVEIDYLQNGVAFRLFTGIVDLPELSLEDQSIYLSCTDDYQSRFSAKPRSAIESIFAQSGARWSRAVFGDYETSEQFAEDLLSTIPASLDLDANGQLVLGHWFLAGYDFQFLDGEVFPDSISVEWGSRRDIINRVNVEAEYTYQFFRERRHRYIWEYPRAFEEYLESSTTLPNSEMIDKAAAADGWTLADKVFYERLPESGEYSLPGGGTTQWIISDEIRQSLAIGADFTIRKRWVQDVRESYFITVESHENVGRYGELAEQLRVSLDTSADETGFGDFESTPSGTSVTIGSDSAWATFSFAEFNGAIETAIARAGVIIQESMRQNSVGFTTLIQPALERHHFIRLSSERVTAEGKCRSFRHEINLEAGSAITEITLAVSRGEVTGGTSLSYNGLNYSEPAVPTLTLLDTKLQDYTGTVPPPGQAFEGYVGNYVSQLNNPPNPFEEKFAILAPEIAESSRNSIEYSESLTVQVETFNQPLTVNL
ncbi:hypothetical protein [Marinobacter nauticus]|uniref:Uncharacterized protein n=1 Tax=Marinobacter nauticus TaxID=2743 RepID=A0A368V161_MARNT|nr:hypothetical protein [Marinobacter nauticus]RBP74113.1 hypothetical protein DET64_105239 [Marinobacter nauticus]RCW34862.1 hypothetical protein DET51_105238 [Marinobacter nauticus]